MNTELQITEISHDVHMLPGIGKIEYIFCRESGELVINVDSIEVQSFSGLIAFDIYKKVTSRKMSKKEEETRIKAMAEYIFGTPFANLCVHTRKRVVLEPRQILMWWTRSNTNWSFTEIGWFLGKFNHATVMKACETVSDLVSFNPGFRGKVDLFLKKVNEFKETYNDNRTTQTETASADDAA